MKFRDLLNEGMMNPLGSGMQIQIDGKVAIKASDRRKINNVLSKGIHFKTVSDLSRYVINAFKGTSVIPIIGNETWTGTFTGSPQTEIMESMKLSLIQDGKEVKNALLILNIYKLPQGTLELNAYIS